MTLEVTLAGPEAAPEVVATIHAGFGAREVLDPPATALLETVDSVRAALADHGGVVARAGGQVVGALLFEPHDDASGQQLGFRRVSVLPEAQGSGVAKVMVGYAEGVAADRGWSGIRLAARSELPATVRFWHGLGYRELEHRGTLLTMAKELPLEYAAATAEDTRDLGRRLGPLLRTGDLVILSGDLGAGKTTFTQGLGSGLGVRGEVTSPTFVIARVHPSRGTGPGLVHVDAYRLGGLDELDDLDLDASVDTSVTVVEWGTGVAEALTEDRLEVRITRATGGDLDERRIVELVPIGTRWLGGGLHTLA